MIRYKLHIVLLHLRFFQSISVTPWLTLEVSRLFDQQRLCTNIAGPAEWVLHTFCGVSFVQEAGLQMVKQKSNA